MHMTETSFTNALKRVANLSEEQIFEAEALESTQGASVGKQLVKKKIITEYQRLETLSVIYGYPFWAELPLDQINTDFVEKVPIQFLKKHVLVPLEQKPDEAEAGDAYIIAMNDPGSFQAVDDLARMLGITGANIVLSAKEAILSAINLCYDLQRGSAEQLVQDMEEDGGDILSAIEDTADLLDDTSDAPIIKLVNHIISQSIKSRASDIHIEPFQTGFKVRNRVDGILYDLLTPPKWIQAALISRIKVMANMNIAEKRLPQDGRFEVRIGDQEIDVRVSTIPTSFGERVVMRLLNKSGAILHISELGPTPEKLERLKRLVKSPNGIILVTGPTGSGKTTSLYAVLSSINTPDINIITIEDPVEYQLKGISQIQVNPKIDLTFARDYAPLFGRIRMLCLSGKSETRRLPISPFNPLLPATWCSQPFTPTIRPAPLHGWWISGWSRFSSLLRLLPWLPNGWSGCCVTSAKSLISRIPKHSAISQFQWTNSKAKPFTAPAGVRHASITVTAAGPGFSKSWNLITG